MAQRVFWGCLIVVATVLLTRHVYVLGTNVTHSNVELIVDNPNYSLENADFPAVTICSNSKVMRSKLFQYLKGIRKDMPSNEKERFIHSVLAMDLMKYPFLHHPNLYMERFNNNLRYIPNEEIFDLFLTVRPNINEMISNCKWRGRMIKCRQLFRKQMTEEGFCYSFNSRTADRSSDDLPRVPPEEKSDGTLECLRNNAAGRDSGLSFALKSLDTEIFKTNLQTRGYSIMVHNPNSYPEVSHKYLVFWKNFTVSRISVLVNMVRTDETFARIAESARGCNMSITDPYICMLRCRQREIYRQCGCLPYYMYHFNRYAETCGIQHFKCLDINNKRFRNARVDGEHFNIPAWTAPMFMSCKCERPCSDTTYTTEYSFIPSEEVTGDITPTGRNKEPSQPRRSPVCPILRRKPNAAKPT
ncbi:pickpocket protein 28-like [Macrosteles quadrilineatus]|uniref:pickpocket protein 28-like n=1 Tax=Macrosteles quadrilineatus TaxID=74068 RepID=UPI0023E14361|nr:pickpocket protein 28-like [Macrosteles quadrilineatus]